MAQSERGAFVGVVGTVHHNGLDVEPRGTLYLPLAQRPTASAFAVVHADGDALALLPQIRAAVAAIDSALPIYDVRRSTIDSRRRSAAAARRVAGRRVCRARAVLAPVGVYGVISYDVSQRAREIGIRIALGAERSSVMRIVVAKGSGSRPAEWPPAPPRVRAGAPSPESAVWCVGVRSADVCALAAVLLAIAVAAAYVPARRAARVNPRSAPIEV